MEETTGQLSVQDFATKIKTKYPQYKDVDDTELAKRIVEKYPQYKEQVNFEQPAQQPATPQQPQGMAADMAMAVEPKALKGGIDPSKLDPETAIDVTVYKDVNGKPIQTKNPVNF